MDTLVQLFWRHYIDSLSTLAAARTSLSDPCALVQRLLLEHVCGSLPVGFNTEDAHDCTDDVTSLPYDEFLRCLHAFHSALVDSSFDDGMAVLSPLNSCRLLYRFDTRCSGNIAAHLFVQRVAASLRERTATAVSYTSPLTTAVRTAKRPDADAFSTPSAVHKLYLARSHTSTGTLRAKSARATRSALVQTGNSHLARIRNLPVSKLLRCVLSSHIRPRTATRRLG